MPAELLDSIVSSNSQELPNASSALKLFANPQFRVRVIMRLGDPWFVAKDACDCLEIADVSQACKNLDDDEKQVVARSPELSLLFTESSNAPTMTRYFEFSDESSENYQTNSSHRGRLLLTPCNAKRSEPCAQQALF